MRRLLDLDPEWGLIELIEAVEERFDIGIADPDVMTCRTMGDLHTLVRARTPDWDVESGPCGSSAVFHALRQALDPGGSLRLRPRTVIDQAWPGSPRALFARIRRETGLRPPQLWLSWTGVSGLVIVLCAIVILVAGAVHGEWREMAAALPIGVAGMLLVRLDPRRLPTGIDTLGDLARRFVVSNLLWLRTTGRRVPDRWTLLTLIAAEQCTVPPEEIGPETLLFESPDGSRGGPAGAIAPPG